MAAATTLTPNDTRILHALFDPESLPSTAPTPTPKTHPISQTLPPHPHIPSSLLTSLETHQTTLIQSITSTSSSSTIQAAIAEEDTIIAQHSEYPSAYLNRAMLRRMRVEAETGSEMRLFEEGDRSTLEGILGDLDSAIKFSYGTTSHNKPSTSSSLPPLSPYQARILRAAYSHRALLYLKAASSASASGDRGEGEEKVVLLGKTKSQLEEMASGDFGAAARCGDEAAREMSVRTNPYARMCGGIVREALREERKEWMERGGEAVV